VPKSRPVSRRLIATAALLIAGAASADSIPGSTAADPTGEWLVAKRIARIKIADCDARLWGVVSWEAQPGIDNKNPDPSLRSRPTLGMPILLGMARTKEDEWEGKIYNSQDGHTYSASIRLLNPNALRVQGCFLGIFCGGENWTRVEPTEVPGARPPANNRKPVASDPPADDVCLRVTGAAGFTHERGLK